MNNNLELFVVYFYEDPLNSDVVTDDAYFIYDKTKLSIDEIAKVVDEHKKDCEEDGIKYNKILLIRKLQVLGLKQIMTYVKDIEVK